jgi:glycosyltransferase involved in cell wall biosynthesis
MAKKKILIFSTDDFVPPAGGAEIAIGEITKRLPEFEFDLFCARIRKNANKFEKRGNVNIYRLGLGIPKIDKFLLVTSGQRQALKIHKKEPYSLVWSVMASYGAFAAVRFKKKTGVPFLLTLQEGDPLEEIERKVKFGSKYFKNIFIQADGLQTISNFLFEWGQRMGFAGKIGKVVPNGVDMEKFKIQRSDLKNKEINLKKELGIKGNEKVIIHHGRYAVKNGLGDLIEAIGLLPTFGCHIGVKLLLVGSGDQKEVLMNKAEKLGLKEKIIFLDNVPNEETPKYLSIADIFARPSLSEGLGNSFLEAMAMGVPVIGTLVGGIPDFLKDGVTGFACRPQDPESIALAVAKIMSLENLELVKVRANALDLVKKEYNWDIVSKKMLDIFNELLGGKN